MASRRVALATGFVIVCLLGVVGFWLQRLGPPSTPAGFDSATRQTAEAPAVGSLPSRAEPLPAKPAQVKPAPSKPEAAKSAASKSAPAEASRGETQASLSPASPTGPVASGGPPAAAPLAAVTEPPTFDVVRVEPSGAVVLAGRGAPHSQVALLAAGKVVAETKIDGNGNFVLIPPPLKAGDHDLTLRQSVGGGAAPVVSRQSVAVKVREHGAGPAVVALAEPGKATELMGSDAPAAVEPDTSSAVSGRSRPAEPTTASKRSAAPVRLAFRSVELENGNGFYATGIASPGTHVEIYLNNSRIAGVVADAGSRWSVKVLKGLTSGRYLVRADAIDAARTVTARAEVAFDVPVPVAMAPAMSAPQAMPTASASSEAPDVAGVDPGSRVQSGSHSAAAPGSRSASDGGEDAVARGPGQDRAEAAPSRSAMVSSVSIVRGPDPSAAAASAKTREKEDPRADLSAKVAASTPAASVSSGSQVGAGAGSAVIQSLETTRVVGGDTLWRISRTRLGLGHRYTQIYAANAAQIRDPNLIYPNQVFVMPVK